MSVDWKTGLGNVIRIARKRKYRTIGLQLPDGMKRAAFEIAVFLSGRTGASVIISGDPCYGACDLALDLEELGVDALVHFGHTGFGKAKRNAPLDVFYVECSIDAELPRKMYDELKNHLNAGETVGLVATAQYTNQLGRLKKMLDGDGFGAIIGTPDRKCALPGQILGCDTSASENVKERADKFVYIGSGGFHPAGVAVSTGKSVLICDIEKREVREIGGERDRLLRKRWALVQKCMDAKTFGIVLSTKSGQRRIALANRLLRLSKKCGKTAFIIALREFTPEALLAFGADAYVSTACPRLAIDDSARFYKPVLTPPEMEIVLGKRKWDDYTFDAC
jgi:2-(3-amino-3-carboxypropyl)histidine synthase